MREMVINYVPGESCRVAVVEDDRLEEFQAERIGAAGHVGNIYVGRVVNVEAAIQAAFIDFGLEQNGFLHVSDLHPRYFPGETDETTERVGKKTPRRERPPIQDCLKKGQEIAVQVLKEGVGTKGPTVTSYLSIPGRFLVMMPQMDRVGVSRRVEDDETRRKMRKILDELDLPDGFGFILRTAGLEQTKRELKRDLAYLQRLWRDMERRWKSGKKPRLLYSESDLLVRAMRDMLTSEIDRIVVDNESALNRAGRFLKIVAPRTSAKLVQYVGTVPIFHASGLDEQIATIHSREVPLKSGGRLVIDETEALVAIDVNSGRMRDAKDAETTALRTNLEAADEICRQLRLRDLGGLVVHDLIDMRPLKHRRQVEQRFKENLKHDRARSTILPISGFGIMEMTRQRMRGSHESVHFADCPVCRGRGLLQRPESVAIDAIAALAALLGHDRVAKAELVISPRIAGELLSSHRRNISRVERVSGKSVDVRVSDAVGADRYVLHAYDSRGADIDVEKLKPVRATGRDYEQWEGAATVEDDNWAEQDEHVEPEIEDIEPVEDIADPLDGEELEAPSKKKRRRRRRKKKAGGAEAEPTPEADEASTESSDADGEETPSKKKRRRRRKKKSGDADVKQDGEEASSDASDAETDEAPAKGRRSRKKAASETDAEQEATLDDGDATAGSDEGEAPKKKRRRRRKKRGSGGERDDNAGEAEARSNEAESESASTKKKTRRRSRKKAGGEADASSDNAENEASEGAPKKKRSRRRSKKSADEPKAETSGDGAEGSSNGTPAQKPRTLYGASRRKLSASEVANLTQE